MVQASPPDTLRALRQWPSRALLATARSIARLPWGVQRRLGAGLGQLGYFLMPGRRHIARTNLQLCFPDMPAARIRVLTRAHFRSVGIGVFETLAAWWQSDAVVAPRVRVSGLENLAAAQRDGSGVILLTGHFTTLEMAARALCIAGVPFHAMYRPHNNPVFDREIREMRARRTGVAAIPRANLRALVRSLRAGGAIWYGPDQTLDRDIIFTDFFGVPTATLRATARLAGMGRARVVPFFARREGEMLHVVIQPAWENFPSGDEYADAQRVNAAIEHGTREAMADYFWLHRRFKLQPPGKPPVY